MTAYTITLTTKTGTEVFNELVETSSVERALDIAARQHDDWFEGRGLLTAYTVYAAEDGKYMGGWLPEGFETPVGIILAEISNLV